MADGIAVKVTGLKELRAALRKIDRGLAKEMTKAHKDLADEIVARALPNVPVRTGRLKASVRGGGTARQAIGRAGGAKVPYAAAIHWGVGPRPGLRGPHNIPRRPFLTDAAARVEPQVVGRYATTVQDLIDRAVR